ncbi:MAG: peptidylprolyl isomerase, partial [Clostridia bacterium]|nr:peptidylprolyl isomerase [Clostridia bacterium]
EGNADDTAEAYLAGALSDEGVNCDHHEHEHEEEGGCGSGCGGGCGGCHGGCGGGPQIYLEGPNAGKTVSVHYTGTLDDGSKFDSSYDRNQPLEFICGAGMMIPGFDKAVCDMEVGQTVDIHLEPEEAYGPVNPNAIMTVELEQLQGSEDLEVGQRVYLSNAMGQPFPVTVTAMDEKTVTFDANHELAGKALNFMIELLSAE